MRTFAQIQDGKLHWLFKSDTDPEFSDELTILEITDVIPQPDEGWSYDGEAFLPPIAKKYSLKDVEDIRLSLYAHPLEGSDLWFAKATRLSMMGESSANIEAAKQAGITRYEEINSEWPLPTQ